MARRTFEGSPHNATADWRVAANEDRMDEGLPYAYVEIPGPCDCGHPHCRLTVYRPHTSGHFFDDEGEAAEWIEATQEDLDRDYDDYYEENHHHIAQMEAYEMWRNEY